MESHSGILEQSDNNSSFLTCLQTAFDEYKFLFQWYDHWLKNTGFFAFVEWLDVWFAFKGSGEAWAAVLWQLKLV